MKYNTKKIYNQTESAGGAVYNSAKLSMLISLYDVVQCEEDTPYLIAKAIISERITPTDFIEWFVLCTEHDGCVLKDKSSNDVLLNFIEKQGLMESFAPIIAALFLSDRKSAIDSIRSLSAALNIDERPDTVDGLDFSALIHKAESLGLDEAQAILALVSEFDFMRSTDNAPRKAVSDFVIGQVDDFDKAYDWIVPFDMKIDWRNTSVQVMPQTESSYIDIPGVDGRIIENTVYKNRLFSIVAYSEQGLSISEKEQMKRDIAQILDATKNSPKKLTFQRSGTCFDVQYSGSADIYDGPSFVRATIPFETSPYGYPLFERSVDGTGLVINDGDADSGCVHFISAGASNPSFKLGTITYTWDGTVPDNSTLVIDHNNYTCYIETVQGKRENAMDRLSGDFQVIPKRSSVAITASPSTEKYLTTRLQEKILW